MRKLMTVVMAAGLLLGAAACDGSAESSTGSASSSSGKPAAKASADPSKLDDEGKFACDDFANGYKSAVTRDARVKLANKVAKWAPKSRTDRIADMSEALGRGADGSPGAWKLAADAFAQACLDAGWKAD